MCRDWYVNFDNFYDWAIKQGYKEELSLDKIHRTKSYGPDNCCFITKKRATKNNLIRVFRYVDLVRSGIITDS